MIYSKEKITTAQCTTLLISTILGVGILSLPRDLVDAVKGDGFIIVICAALISLPIEYCIYKTIKNFKHKSFFEINSILLNKPIAYVVSAIHYVAYIYIGGLIIRVFAEGMKMYMLPDTPTEVIVITMVLVCVYSARGGIEGIARLSQILVFLIIVPIIIVYILALSSSDFSNLMPILNNDIVTLVSSTSTTIFAFSGFEALLILGFFLKKPNEAFKVQYIALIIIVLIYVFFTIITIAVFGQSETSHLLWPTLTLVKVIDVPGSFLQNLDAVIMGAWTINIFMSVSINFYISSILLGDVLNCKETNYLLDPIIPIVYSIALYPNNLAQLYDFLSDIFFMFLQIFTVIIIPIFLFILMVIKNKMKNNTKKN